LAEGLIDLRSDTVTEPTPAMRAAMAEAEVGDDVYGEDPTVNRLQETAAVRFGRDRFPLTPTSLVCVEQTHNRRGGTYYSVEHLMALRKVCDGASLPLYMDGARVFNAAVASGTDPAEYGRLVDGLMFCLSKALGAPIGSLMVGDAEAIAEAKLWRRRYGGAMRQAGVLAAAGLVALEQMVSPRWTRARCGWLPIQTSVRPIAAAPLKRYGVLS
jgi:threonine aldolase